MSDLVEWEIQRFGVSLVKQKPLVWYQAKNAQSLYHEQKPLVWKVSAKNNQSLYYKQKQLEVRKVLVKDSGVFMLYKRIHNLLSYKVVGLSLSPVHQVGQLAVAIYLTWYNINNNNNNDI